MEDEQQAHLDSIVVDFSELVTKKYTAGQKEHGGKLWEKAGIIDMAIDEAIDQVVYLLTLKHQLDEAGIVLGTLHDKA